MDAREWCTTPVGHGRVEPARDNVDVDITNTPSSTRRELSPSTLVGIYSQNDQPFPGMNFQYAKMALVDVVSKDPIDLARTFEGGYETRLLPGTYDVL